MQIKNLILLIGFLLSIGSASAQLISSEFGQNRIQYEKYKWQRFETPSFAFSFTEENENMMKFLVPIAEASYHELKSVLEYQVRQKIEVIVYSDFSDFAQSNVGLVSPSVNSGGVTKLLDNKMLIYFDGNHQNLQKQVREGITRALLNRMLFGSNLQEVVQNSVLLNLPEWFTEGIVAYAVEEWSTADDDKLRDAFFSKKYDNFLELAQQHPHLAGKSLFHYIARNHGTASVSNLLYLTRINRSVESGFLYVFGTSFYTIAGTNWFNYYSSRYNEDNNRRLFPNAGELELKLNKKAIVKDVSLSPNGKLVAYVEHQEGEQRVVMVEVESGIRQTVWKGGVKDHSKELDENYPLLAWRKNSSQLMLFFEKKDKPMLAYINADTKKQAGAAKRIRGLERILTVSVVDNEQMVLTGIYNGYSDVFLLKGTEAKALTKDKWDDADAIAVELNGCKGIIFASNRPQALLNPEKSDNYPLGNMDLFFYDLNNKEGGLYRLTETPLANERLPQQVDATNFAYLSDLNGISNRFIGQLDTIVDYYQQVVMYNDGRAVVLPKDSTISPDSEGVDSTFLQPVYKVSSIGYANTDYSRGILEHSMSSGLKVADLLYRDSEYHLFVRELKVERSAEPAKTRYRLILERQNGWLSDAEKAKIKGDKVKKLEKNPDVAKEAEKQLAKELERLEKEMNEDSTQSTPSDSLPPKPVYKDIDTTKVDIDNYTFQTEFDEVKKPDVNPKENKADTVIKPIILEEGKNGEITKKDPPKIESKVVKNAPNTIDYDPSRKRRYRNMFKVDALTFQLDNTPLFWGMDLYLEGTYRFPTLGLMFKTAFTDIFEDYRLEIGMRMPINFNGMEYFITFEDRKHRLDKKFSLYRRGRIDRYLLTDTSSNVETLVRGRNIKHVAMAEFRYPFTKFSAFRGTASLHADKVAVIAENQNSLRVPIYNETRLGLRAEYVFDNTVNLRLNARKGTRARFYADIFQPMGVQIDSSLKITTGSPTIALGLDARHYVSFDNKTIFAFRFMGATSFGKQKILYSLGGMENWLIPTFNETIPLPDGNEFAYQILSSNLRGFQSNARNGSSVALINAEMRIPVTEYLSRTPPRNVLLRNLQVIAFYDIGTAWQGLSPFSTDNPLNTTLIDPGAAAGVVSPIRVRVNYYRRPIIQGAGFGIRTVFLGYFLRMDYAWGIETGALQKPMVYLSLGTDF